MEIDIKNIRKIHFIGIGGIGVSALAKIMLWQGVKVQGSDLVASEITEKMQEMGGLPGLGQ